MQMIKRLMGLFAAVLLLAAAPASFAQAIFGSITGTVADSTGALIPGATITVTDTAKGTSVTATSNASGEFTIDHLIPDTYSVKVTMNGFKAFATSGLTVSADETRKLDAVMQTGASGETITVSADSVPQLKTDRADVSTTFQAQEIGELPIPDHNFTNLQLLLPGAVQLGWAHAASENPQGSKQIQIDGQAFGGVNYTLDGTDNQDAILGIIVINPNSESMAEVKIATQNFDAEFGKAVASVQTVQTKSGTNAFHGTLFDNRESNANLARDPFSTGPGYVDPGGLKNQFGGSVGGPILKDKIFFFGDYQGVRQRSGGTGVATVPTQQVVNSCLGAAGYTGCDFSQYLNTTAAHGNHLIYDITTGQPFGGAICVTAPSTPGCNVIPLNRLSRPALKLFSLLQPLVNADSAAVSNLTSNYAGSGTGIFNSNQWDIRGDATLSEKIHVFGRFSRFTDTLSGASLFGAAGGPGLGIAGYGGVSQGANDSLALGTDIAVTPKLVTDVRLGYFRYNITTHKNDPGSTNLPFYGQNVNGPNNEATLAITTDFGVPDIDIADVTATTPNYFAGNDNGQNTGPQFGTGLQMNHCNCPLKEKEDQFQIVNNWTKTIGNHSVKFGADIRYARNLRVPSDTDRSGEDKFDNGPTSNGSVGGLGFATFILGDVSRFGRYSSTSTNAKEFQKRDYFYVQDTWRATPKLTINAGLRYEFYGPERVNGAGNGALLNLQTGYINVAGEGGLPLNMGVAAAKNTYNPRLGVAYQYNDKTVIRAGYGRSFDLGVFGSDFGHVVTQNIPVLANQSLSPTGAPTSYAFNLSDPANSTLPGVSSPLSNFVAPATNSAGQIPITAIIPSSISVFNPTGSSVGSAVNVKARPFTERLPTLDAWNLAVQRALTPTISVEVAYVANKGTHTLSDGDGNNTNPNESAIFLPASFTQNGVALHYDNIPADVAAIATYCTTNTCNNGIPTAGPYAGATNNGTLLQRYTNGTLPACGGGPCGWTQGITYYGDDQDTHYNAIQSKLTKTYTHGLSINLNYAYARGRDTASNFATWNKSAVIGNDSAIRRSAFTAYGLYKLPFGPGQQFLGHSNALIGYLVEGWEYSPVFQWQSGLPYSLSYGECGATIPGDAPCQPNGRAASLKTSIQGIPSLNSNSLTFFNPSPIGTNGFTAPGLDQIGNVNRNSVFGPRFFNADMSISKNLTFKEKYTAQFRMDAFNAFNHINFGNPNGNIETGGNITNGPFPASLSGTTNPRQLQFTLHFQF